MIKPAELTSELFDIPFIRWSPAKIQPAIASFSAGAFRRQPALSNNPVNFMALICREIVALVSG